MKKNLYVEFATLPHIRVKNVMIKVRTEGVDPTE